MQKSIQHKTRIHSYHISICDSSTKFSKQQSCARKKTPLEHNQTCKPPSLPAILSLYSNN